MNKSSLQKSQYTSYSEYRFEAAMNSLRARYLAAGVTPQELAEIERVSLTGDAEASGRALISVFARLDPAGLALLAGKK